MISCVHETHPRATGRGDLPPAATAGVPRGALDFLSRARDGYQRLGEPCEAEKAHADPSVLFRPCRSIEAGSAVARLGKARRGAGGGVREVIFLDTSAIYAWADAADPNHSLAVRHLQVILE